MIIKGFNLTGNADNNLYYLKKVLNKNQMVKAQVQKISKNLMTILGLISIFINIFKSYKSKKSELNKNNKYTTTIISI